MRIYIDGVEVDTDMSTRVAITLNVNSLTEFATAKTGYTKTLDIPSTRKNKELIGDHYQVNGTAKFNAETHTARIEAQGCVVMEGVVRLKECVKNLDSSGRFRLIVTGNDMRWVRQAEKFNFRDIPVDFSETLSGEMIQESWKWDKPVRFLPVLRSGRETVNDSKSLFFPLSIFTAEDYHPFINLSEILKAIFSSCGYSVKSRFLNSDYFRTLYVSGNFPGKDIERLKSRMDFRAGRIASATARADQWGRVYAIPETGTNSVGNIVDSVSGGETEGFFTEKLFNTNDCFSTDEKGSIVFVPTSEVTVSFEYNLHYTTEYYLESREKLRGFDTIDLRDGFVKQYRISNKWTDYRNNATGGKSYTFIAFEWTEGETFLLRYDEITSAGADPSNLKPGEYTTYNYPEFSSRSRSMTLGSAAANRIVNMVLWVKAAGSDSYVLYTRDWALYEGNVAERGETHVEIRVKSAPEKVTPANPKYFNNISFSGASPGMKITLKNTTTLRPVFGYFPSPGEAVAYRDIANHPINGLQIINAVRQMFNLCFYTDEITGTVYIEPRDDFFTEGNIVDWSDRIDFLKPVSLSDTSEEVGRSLTLSYENSDTVLSGWNFRNGEKFGTWTKWIDGAGLSQGKTISNAVFTPSLNNYGEQPYLKTAYILSAGDSGDDGTYNIPFKIVHYPGRVPLGGKEKWGWPSYSTTYPFLAFHHPGAEQEPGTGIEPDPDGENAFNMYAEGFSLCFEDRDGQKGLHRFYDRQIETCAGSKRLEAHLSLRPADIEPFLRLNEEGGDFRALFKLNVDGEDTLFRLEKICDYDPSSRGSCKCIFTKLV